MIRYLRLRASLVGISGPCIAARLLSVSEETYNIFETTVAAARAIYGVDHATQFRGAGPEGDMKLPSVYWASSQALRGEHNPSSKRMGHLSYVIDIFRFGSALR